MFDGKGLAISIPATELPTAQLPGSVFKMSHLITADLSPELRCALDLVEYECGLNRDIVCIARPELFTHGETLQWLCRKLGGIRDHLCISDGSTIRPIPTMRNHVFFHALGRQSDQEALARLEKRVPELFSSVASQINSALRFKHDRRYYIPPTTILRKTESNSCNETADLYRFYLNRDSTEDSVARILRDGVCDRPHLRFDNVLYLPLTESAAADPSFCDHIAITLQRTYFELSRAVIIRLPQSISGAPFSLSDSIGCVLGGLSRSEFRIPRVLASNIFFARQDLTIAALGEIATTFDLQVHDTFDFWRASSPYYEAFGTVLTFVRRGRHHGPAFISLVDKIYGRNARVRRLPLKKTTT